jgi:hypothetical protein
MSPTKDELKELTRKYWGVKDWHKEDESKMQRYVRELLRGELANKKYLPEGIAKDDHEKENAKTKGNIKWDILVIMLGHSFEPLLQAIVAYQPKQVLMVLNKKYDDEKDGEVTGVRYYESAFESAFELLKDNQLVSDKPIILPDPMRAAGDTPVEIFRFLRQELLTPINDSKRVVIDITGAKKSMVAGAYLFAAFADVPVSYVDFETYSPKEGKPYGYTCIIEEIKSPTETFRLREWEHVRQLYEHYAFRTARELLNDELIPAMNDWFEVDEIEAANRLKQALEIYELWDKGDYNKALEQYEQLRAALVSASSFLLPTAIDKLSGQHPWGQWPLFDPDPKSDFRTEADKTIQSLKKLERGDSKTTESFYLDWEHLLIYCYDERDKISRLIKLNQDYRSALLRAAGLNEVLLRARIVFICDKRWISFSSNIGLAQQLSSVVKLGLNEMNSLFKDGHLTFRRNNDSIQLDRANIPADLFLASDVAENVGAIADLRNKAIHFCLYVPELFAQAALGVAIRNLTNFEQSQTLGQGKAKVICWTNASSWAKLCVACGVDFLPLVKE